MSKQNVVEDLKRERAEALKRCYALATMDLSKPLTNHKLGVSGRSLLDVPIGTPYGHWKTVSAPYPKKYGAQSHTAIDVRCKCGDVYPRILSSLRRGRSTQCESCGRKSDAKQS